MLAKPFQIEVLIVVLYKVIKETKKSYTEFAMIKPEYIREREKN